jgi:hypothetical protein
MRWSTSESKGRSLLWFGLIIIGLLLVGRNTRFWTTSFFGRSHDSGDEYPLIKRISSEKDLTERARLIAELERMPVRIYQYHDRWLLINNVAPYDAWDEEGFHPERSCWPRNVQLLWATSYGKADIDNGGFHQFFSNNTGMYAPEMQECLAKMGLVETAGIVKKAMLVFGEPYPRSQDAREKFLRKFPGERREEWDPFHALDDQFYESSKSGDAGFHERADRWLREECGIKRLSD